MGVIEAMAKKLNPFQCHIFEVEKGSDEFIEICKYINLNTVPMESMTTIFVDELDIRMKILRLGNDWYDVSIIKGKEGFLGHY